MFVTIHVVGFQTVPIFMQTGDPGETARSDVAAYLMSDVVDDSPHKVISWISCCSHHDSELFYEFLVKLAFFVESSIPRSAIG